MEMAAGGKRKSTRRRPRFLSAWMAFRRSDPILRRRRSSSELPSHSDISTSSAWLTDIFFAEFGSLDSSAQNGQSSIAYFSFRQPRISAARADERLELSPFPLPPVPLASLFFSLLLCRSVSSQFAPSGAGNWKGGCCYISVFLPGDIR
uniref:Uncharacterized protein n=1 Tax=Arundo donax TaxID=35708 RepID=A0A0A9EJD7_ARUDO